MLPSVSRPRARWLSPMIAGPLDERRHRLDRGHGDERDPRRDATPLEVEHERARVRGQDEQADRERDGEEADEGLRGEVDALGRGVERADRRTARSSRPG